MLYERGHQEGPDGGFTVLQSNTSNPANSQTSTMHLDDGHPNNSYPADNGHPDISHPDNGHTETLHKEEEIDMLCRDNSGGTSMWENGWVGVVRERKRESVCVCC